MEIVNDAVAYLTTILQNTGILLGVFLVILESIIPALPLGVFIALNINAFGLIIGIIISWLSTCFGCYLAFSFYRRCSQIVPNHPYVSHQRWGIYWLSGNLWLVSFKISYLCLPLFYETRTTPSCHPSGCAYRQL